MASESRLRPIGRVVEARKCAAKRDLRVTGSRAGGRGKILLEPLEERRLLSVASLSGAALVSEGSPYTLNFSASGIGSASGSSDWTVNWASGVSDVLPGNATSAVHTYDDGPSSQNISAYRTNTISSGLVTGDGDISINDVAIDSLGRIVTVGSVGAPSWLEVRRFNPDGSPDTTFSGDGVYNIQLSGTTSARLVHLAIDTSNRVVAVGDVTTVPFGRTEGLVARFNDSGLDTTFNPSGSGGGQAGTARANFGKAAGEDAKASAIVVQPDGKLLIGGTITDASGTALDFGLARFDASGASDPTFSGGSVRTDFGAAEDLHGLAISTSGSTVTGIYAAGDRNQTRFAISAYNANGSPNTAFAGGTVLTDITTGADVASNVVVDNSGRVVAAGTAGGAIGLARYNPNGSPDTSFGTSGTQTSTAATGSYVPDQLLANLVIDSAGNLLVGARLSSTSAPRGFGVARYNSSGAPDGTFGKNGLIFRATPDLFGGAIALQLDGGIVQAITTPDASSTFERNAVILFYANASKGVLVQNVAPTASLTGDPTGAPHQGHAMQIASDDVSAADRAAGMSVSINWGDGSPVELIAPFPVGTIPFARVYNEAGVYTVTFTVTDKDGGTAVATTTFTVATAAVVTDEVDGSQILVVAGTRTGGPGGSNSNTIDLRPNAGGIRVNVDGVITNVGAPISRVVAYGDGGDDVITVTGSISLPVEFYGGDGNDSLRGGGRDDILAGGAGNDLLVGGNGRDILLGGQGADRLVGDSDDDILIGGTFLGEELWGEFGIDRFSLAAIRTEWSSGHTYMERVSNLRDGTGTPGSVLNEGVYLVADVTVFDDAEVDVLTGDSGRDWFFANVDGEPKDIITDLTSKEFADDLDFIAGV